MATGPGLEILDGSGPGLFGYRFNTVHPQTPVVLIGFVQSVVRIVGSFADTVLLLCLLCFIFYLFAFFELEMTKLVFPLWKKDEIKGCWT